MTQDRRLHQDAQLQRRQEGARGPPARCITITTVTITSIIIIVIIICSSSSNYLFILLLVLLLLLSLSLLSARGPPALSRRFRSLG